MPRKKLTALLLSLAAASAIAAPASASAATVPASSAPTGVLPFSWHCC